MQDNLAIIFYVVDYKQLILIIAVTVEVLLIQYRLVKHSFPVSAERFSTGLKQLRRGLSEQNSFA